MVVECVVDFSILMPHYASFGDAAVLRAAQWLKLHRYGKSPKRTCTVPSCARKTEMAVSEDVRVGLAEDRAFFGTSMIRSAAFFKAIAVLVV